MHLSSKMVAKATLSTFSSQRMPIHHKTSSISGLSNYLDWGTQKQLVPWNWKELSWQWGEILNLRWRQTYITHLWTGNSRYFPTCLQYLQTEKNLSTKDNNHPTCPPPAGAMQIRKVHWDLEQWGLSHWLCMCFLNTTQISDCIRVRKGPLTI